MKYVRRIVDEQLDRRLKAFNAVNIVGPKGCGKTRTAKERCKTVIEFQDELKRDSYLSIAEISPNLFLDNEKPILFDEWQDAPKIWGMIRKACDDSPGVTGEYFLTGSTSKHVDTAHTGTGRITTITMWPMTLFETGESNGKISLMKLLCEDNYIIDGAKNDIELRDLFFVACRGGWPRCIELSDDSAKLEIARDYYSQIYLTDISNVDGVKRNSDWTKTILWSYARNMATLAKRGSILTDIKANHDISDTTIDSYITALKQLFVLEDIDAWTPQIRSKTSIRTAKKHIFVDPSIGVAALGLSPGYFARDLDTFGHVFENLVLRDLCVYARAHDARVLHYSDNMGLEADAVFQLNDGRYALIEIKLGANAIPAAEKELLKFSAIIKKHNEKALENKQHPGVVYREPEQLVIICGNAPMAYTTKAGVKVIPIGCLRE